MPTYTGQANLKARAFFSIPGGASLSSLAHTTGDLHKPGETNSIGLVMMAGVEFAGARDIIPSGTNREYGYWRGGYNRVFTQNFDQAFFPLEGSGIYNGIPQVTVTTSSSSGGTAEDGTKTDCGEKSCVWSWNGSAWEYYTSFCITGCQCPAPPTESGDYIGDMRSKPCEGGSSSSGAGGVGDNVGYAEWFKAGTLNDSLGQEAIQQRSLFLSKRSFVSAGSGINLGSSRGYSIYAKVVPSGDVTGTVILAQHKQNPAQFVLGCDYDGSYYIRSDHSVSGINVPVFAKTPKSFEAYQYPTHIFGVYSSGDSQLKIYVNGKEEGSSPRFTRDKKRFANTNVVLGKRELGLAERGFTGWIDEAGVSSKSFEPSQIKKFYDSTFNITDLIFNAKVTPISSAQGTATITVADGDDNTADQFTEGAHLVVTSVDDTKRVYVLCDGSESGSPATGTVITAGDDIGAGTLGSATADKGTCVAISNNLNTHTQSVVLNEMKAAIVHANGHNGKITASADVSGDGEKTITLTQAAAGNHGAISSTFTDSIVTISDFTGGVQSGLSGRDFGDTGIDALKSDYVELIVDSGVAGTLNPTGARGGAFDKDLWGQTDYAVSSVLTFDLTELPTRFHQLTDLSVDLWVEHSTNHPSGADLSARLINKKPGIIAQQNLYWHPSGVSVPSGEKRLISISHPLKNEAHYRDGRPSFKNDFDDHQLEISLKYPKSDYPYDAEFKIYSSKLSFSGFDSLATYNTQQGLIEAGVIKGHAVTNIDGDIISYASGDKSLTMMSFGASPTLSSGIMNMFVDVGTADQALNLVLNQDLQTSMGHSAQAFMFGNAAIAMKDDHKATATITVADGDDNTSDQFTEGNYIILTSADGTVRVYVLCDGSETGPPATGTILTEGSDTGVGTLSSATAALGTCVAVNNNLNTHPQFAVLNEIKAAIVHANGHDGKITAGVDVSGDGEKTIAFTQATAGIAGNIAITSTITDSIVTVSGFAGGLAPLRQMGLYTVGGLIDSNLTIFLKTIDPSFLSSPALNLEIAGTHLSFPRDQKTMPLFFSASAGFGSYSDTMNLVIPEIRAPIQFNSKLLYIRGLQPIGNIPLYLKVAEPKLKTSPLFVRGPRFYSTNGNMNMFVQQKDMFGAAYVNAVPTIVGTGNMPLFMKVRGFLGSVTAGVKASATITVADGDNNTAGQFTEGTHLALISTDGTKRVYILCDGSESGAPTTGTILTEGSDTGASTLPAETAAKGTCVAVLNNLNTHSQSVILNEIKTAIVHTNGHNGKIAASADVAVSDGVKTITLTQAAAGSAGNRTTTSTITDAILTATSFTGGIDNPTTMNFAMPNVMGSGTNTTTLRIRGYK